MDKLVEKVVKTIEKYNMVEPKDKIIVAVSGGPDSICLLHVFRDLQSRMELFLVVAHVHHGIRGKEADIEANFVRSKADFFHLPFEQLSVSVPLVAREQNLSVEQTGRMIRYQFFMDLQQKYNAQRIALGHHVDDQVETILMRMIRGSGLQGLRGIPPIRNQFIRPLIDCSRREIEEYCHRYKLQYYVDSSNKEPKYLRNKIRHQLIPLLTEQYNSSVSKHLIQLQEIVQDELSFWEKITRQYFLKIIKKESHFGIILDNKQLKRLPVALQRRIIQMGLRQLNIYLSDIQFNHIESVRQLSISGEGEKCLDLPRGIKIRKRYQDLEIMNGDQYSQSKAKDYPNHWEYPLPIGGMKSFDQLGITMMTNRCDKTVGYQMNDLKNTKRESVYVDYDQLLLPLKIRNRRPGDRYMPLNSQFLKKIKSYFIDQKIPRHERDNIILVVDNSDRIVWITGFQLDNRFKITEQTKRVLCIEKINKVD